MSTSASASQFEMEAVLGGAVVRVVDKSTLEERVAEELGVRVEARVRSGPRLTTWRVGREDGAPAALVTLAADATPDEREKLGRALTALRAAGDSLEGVLPVRAIAESGDAFLTDLWTLGTARDLPALRWPLQRRLAFVGKVARSIEALHAAGIVHGCLGLDNVLLDDDLQPVLSEVSLVDLRNVVAADPSSPYARSAPPELTTVGRVTASGDLFAIGRLLEDLVSPEERALPLVAELVMGTVAPEGSRFSDAGKLAQGIQAAVSEVSIADGISTVLAPATAPRPRKPAAAEPTPAPAEAEGTRMPWLGVAGTILAVGALAMAAFIGGSHDSVRVALVWAVPVGLAAASTLVPPLPRARTLGRLALAVGFVGLAFVVNPVAIAFRIAAQSRLHGDEASRRQAIAEILRMDRDFRGLSLSGINLSGLDLTGADLRGVSLAGSDLRGARLQAAEVDGASFDGALLGGADLTGTALALATMGTARCDDATRLPAGFRCADGAISRGPAAVP